MPSCPFYKVHQHRQEIRTISGLEDVITARMPYCTHDHSPVPFRIATQTIGGHELLKCEGDLGRCQVAAEFRPKL
jgi:hypothetical protein